MARDPVWIRLRNARLVRLLAVYLAAAWVILRVAPFLIDRFRIPGSFMPASNAFARDRLLRKIGA